MLRSHRTDAHPARATTASARTVERVARQTLRLARLATGDYDSADVGTDA
jgi:hypothetical protein